MKIIFNKNELIEAVAPLMGAVSNKNTIAAIEGILFEALEDGKCVLTTFDLEKGVRNEVQAEVSESGSFIINAVKFNQIIRTMPDEDITIEINGNSSAARISAGRSSFELPALNGSDFPSMPMLVGDRGFTIQQGTFRRLINQILFAVAQNDTRPALNGAFFRVQGSKITAVACNGNHLALREKTCELENRSQVEGELQMQFIIPGKTLSELVKLIDDSEEPLTLLLGRKHVIFAIGALHFFSRVIDSEYIDYERFIPKSNRVFVKINCTELVKCLERAMLVTEDRTVGHTKPPLKCNFEDGAMKVSSISVNGSIYEEIPIEKEGDDIEIGFNCRYMLDALRSCGEETIKLSLSTPLMSMIAEPVEAGDETFTYLILPVRM